jgi:hypothetical protein
MVWVSPCLTVALRTAREEDRPRVTRDAVRAGVLISSTGRALVTSFSPEGSWRCAPFRIADISVASPSLTAPQPCRHRDPACYEAVLDDKSRAITTKAAMDEAAIRSTSWNIYSRRLVESCSAEIAGVYCTSPCRKRKSRSKNRAVPTSSQSGYMTCAMVVMFVTASLDHARIR